MNKILKYSLIGGGVLLALWTVGRLTNTLQWFSTSTGSNYPTIKPGDGFFASNLVTAERFDFICYKTDTPEFGKQIWAHRLCGLEGDTIEIRSGDLFVNNKYVDSSLSVAQSYILDIKELQKLRAVEELDESFIQYVSGDSVHILLPISWITTHSIIARRQILDVDKEDKYIAAQFAARWNQDNFGPVVVPKNKYFVLGDNRPGSQDSRYLGFIDKSEYVATVMGR